MNAETCVSQPDKGESPVLIYRSSAAEVNVRRLGAAVLCSGSTPKIRQLSLTSIPLFAAGRVLIGSQPSGLANRKELSPRSQPLMKSVLSVVLTSERLQRPGEVGVSTADRTH